MQSIMFEHVSLIMCQEGHEEAQEELPKKAKYFFSTAVQNWDAEFYVKVDDNIDLDLGKHSYMHLFLHKIKYWYISDIFF